MGRSISTSLSQRYLSYVVVVVSYYVSKTIDVDRFVQQGRQVLVKVLSSPAPPECVQVPRHCQRRPMTMYGVTSILSSAHLFVYIEHVTPTYHCDRPCVCLGILTRNITIKTVYGKIQGYNNNNGMRKKLNNNH